MTSTSKTPSLNEQCLSIVAAMNAMTPGINQVLFIREIMPTDVVIDDAFHFKTDRDLALYKTLINDNKMVNISSGSERTKRSIVRFNRLINIFVGHVKHRQTYRSAHTVQK